MLVAMVLIGYGVSVFSAYADYYLMAPSAEYAPFMDGVKVKCHMSKVIIEFLQDNQDATYEDLLNKLQVRFLHVDLYLLITEMS